MNKFLKKIVYIELIQTITIYKTIFNITTIYYSNE